MNNSKLTKLPPVELGFVQDARRPVLFFCMDVENAGCASAHAHPRGQVIFASCGVMRVITDQNIWLVPPSQAVWVPPQVEHSVLFPGKVSIRNLFIDEQVAASLPDLCMVFDMTPLLRELILRAGDSDDLPVTDGPAARRNQVILDELALMQPAPFNLPMGNDPRLCKVMDALIECPDDSRALNEWAKTAGASARTLARLFIRETDMTFGEWRAQLRLLEAIDRIGWGQSVTRVAFDLGYQSLSAFIAMFRRRLGVTPSRYFHRMDMQ